MTIYILKFCYRQKIKNRRRPLQKQNEDQARESEADSPGAACAGRAPAAAREDVPALLARVQRLHVRQGTVGGGGEVGVPGGEQVEDTGLEVDVLHWHLLVAVSTGSLQGVARPGRRQRGARHVVPQDGRHLALPVVDALAQGAAIDAQLQVLALLVGHGQVLGHAHGQRQVAPQLPHEDRGPDVAGVHLHVAATLPLHDEQALGVAVPAARAAVHKGGRQVIGHSLVHFLICTLPVSFEDDGDLGAGTHTNVSSPAGTQTALPCGRSRTASAGAPASPVKGVTVQAKEPTGLE